MIKLTFDDEIVKTGPEFLLGCGQLVWRILTNKT